MADTGKIVSLIKSIFGKELTDVKTAIQGKYTKPSGGIPATDIADGVIPVVDSALSYSSENAVQNKVVKGALDTKAPVIINTATGNPAVFNDGGGMPLKSLLIPFTPVQSGTGDPSPQNIRNILPWNGLAVFGGGKNLLNPSVENSIPFQNANYNKYTLTDGVVVTSGNTLFGFKVKVKPNTTYRFTFDTSESITMEIFSYTTEPSVIQNDDRQITNIANNTWKFTTFADTEWILCGIYTLKVGVTVRDFRLTAGSAQEPYEPYVPITETTIPFPSPVYGGEHEAVSGRLFSEWAEIASYNGETLPGEWLSDRDVYSAGTTPTIGAQVVYKLATPTEQTLTGQHINSLVGGNTIWSDADGKMIVEYPADTALFIANQHRNFIAPELSSMIADTALVKNDFRIVGNNLYKITTAIASGGMLTPNTNCVKTTLAEVIKPLLT